ncbi:hypothetical protein OSTOST_01259 [Ostertagia ostertagi]
MDKAKYYYIRERLYYMEVDYKKVTCPTTLVTVLTEDLHLDLVTVGAGTYQQAILPAPALYDRWDRFLHALLFLDLVYCATKHCHPTFNEISGLAFATNDDTQYVELSLSEGCKNPKEAKHFNLNVYGMLVLETKPLLSTYPDHFTVTTFADFNNWRWPRRRGGGLKDLFVVGSSKGRKPAPRIHECFASREVLRRRRLGIDGICDASCIYHSEGGIGTPKAAALLLMQLRAGAVPTSAHYSSRSARDMVATFARHMKYDMLKYVIDSKLPFSLLVDGTSHDGEKWIVYLVRTNISSWAQAPGLSDEPYAYAMKRMIALSSDGASNTQSQQYHKVDTQFLKSYHTLPQDHVELLGYDPTKFPDYRRNKASHSATDEIQETRPLTKVQMFRPIKSFESLASQIQDESGSAKRTESIFDASMLEAVALETNNPIYTTEWNRVSKEDQHWLSSRVKDFVVFGHSEDPSKMLPVERLSALLPNSHALHVLPVNALDQRTSVSYCNPTWALTAPSPALPNYCDGENFRSRLPHIESPSTTPQPNAVDDDTSVTLCEEPPDDWYFEQPMESVGRSDTEGTESARCCPHVLELKNTITALTDRLLVVESELRLAREALRRESMSVQEARQLATEETQRMYGMYRSERDKKA